MAVPDLESGLRLLVDALRLNGGVDVHFSVDASLEARLASEARGHLLFLAREAVSNVLRHARARSVELTLKRAGDSAVLRIKDDGRGFSVGEATQAGQGRRGLHGLAERARLIGGTLSVTSTPGGGTQICLEIPLSA
jgi:signal transduction histidine kinase